ncbi:hypothetical protein [Salsuginibacillus kocurii]|uniref:hypothetical protein n=1 Tax=Salsuginibacillus kocurii TaxID=427078 RepID=UPI00036B7FBA|nr:hypothetical protein [Salsuginibacillus kocurii]
MKQTAVDWLSEYMFMERFDRFLMPDVIIFDSVEDALLVEQLYYYLLDKNEPLIYYRENNHDPNQVQHLASYFAKEQLYPIALGAGEDDPLFSLTSQAFSSFQRIHSPLNILLVSEAMRLRRLYEYSNTYLPFQQKNVIDVLPLESTTETSKAEWFKHPLGKKQMREECERLYQWFNGHSRIKKREAATFATFEKQLDLLPS